jgi:hypothetical protein
MIKKRSSLKNETKVQFLWQVLCNKKAGTEICASTKGEQYEEK